jgi:hypothetical protein
MICSEDDGTCQHVSECGELHLPCGQGLPACCDGLACTGIQNGLCFP